MFLGGIEKLNPLQSKLSYEQKLKTILLGSIENLAG